MTIQEVHLSYPRGPCAGIVRTIDIFEGELEYRDRIGKTGTLYGYHQIVHNKHIVSDFEKRGVEFVDDIEKVPDGSTVIYSPHGVSLEVRRNAYRRNLDVIDATCPFVQKVHDEVRRFASLGYNIIVVGQKNHQEVVGVVSESPNMIFVVENFQDVGKLTDLNGKIAYATQTTLNADDTIVIIDALRARYNSIEGPSKGDICYATKNRQDAIKKLIEKYSPDLFLILGSKDSSNTNKLLEVAKSNRIDSYRIDDVEEIKTNMKILDGKKVIGISSGASAPEYLVQETIEFFKELGVSNDSISEFKPIDEKAVFTIPDRIKERWLSQ